MMHDLKVWPEYYEAIISGVKNFELRKHDRRFEVGDKLLLKEYSLFNGYSGRACKREICYILKGGEFGLQEGYSILGLAIDKTLER